MIGFGLEIKINPLGSIGSDLQQIPLPTCIGKLKNKFEVQADKVKMDDGLFIPIYRPNCLTRKSIPIFFSYLEQERELNSVGN